VPPAVLLHLRELSVDLGGGQAVSQALTSLVAELTSTISSYAGLQVTIIDFGHPVVWTVFTNLDHTPVTASLRLPLTLAVPGVFEAGSRAVFWTHTPVPSSTSPPTSATP
jgi:hypothetical protein